MVWNWQLEDWPNFRYDERVLAPLERHFLLQSGELQGAFVHIPIEQQEMLSIDLMSDEALKTSEIEGEFLNRESLRSSIKRNFGLSTSTQRVSPAEQGIAEMIVDLYRHYSTPLSNNTLFDWHKMVCKGREDIDDLGRYRTHPEAMQILSGRVDKPTLHFEAPPSSIVSQEMTQFIKWFNHTGPNSKASLPTLIRAGIAHLYFVNVHPFEDGNGRLARALSEKALAQALSRPSLIALSTMIQQDKKAYYKTLGLCNQTNEITPWLEYFSKTILQAQQHTKIMIHFLFQKTRFFDQYHDRLNTRQEKVIARIFRAGPNGFEGGLSAKNYIAITRASRATVTRDLQDLVNKGIFNRTGELKSARYHLNLSGLTSSYL